ncbi:hypothetical protein AALH30_09260 [Blautia pseudococcoides]|uniref:hypothetical protein n=1 Tax=Blautia pseudococcoides TaxID=1796616 RepID=UPI00148B1E8C|nr:hypothetical protein [Blautia pseudococcoides]QJU16189.1 hypothetical protein HL650_18165 [Blautia pseudococcoides]
MIHEVYEAYLLSQEEFGILLRASGCSAFYGFPIEGNSLNRKELLLKLHQMVKKGFLISDGKRFLMDTALASCVRILADAKKMLLVSVKDPPLPVYCCYPGRQIVICEWMSRRDGYVKLKQTDSEKFYEMLVEEGYFPAMGEGSLQLLDNRTGSLERSLTLQRIGLEQVLLLETEEGRTGKLYSEDAIEQMFCALTGGGFYDIG